MIDFEKELRKFEFMKMDEGLMQLKNESSIVLTAFQDTLKRFSREQSKTNTQLEEILGLVEDEQDSSTELSALKEDLAASENEKLLLIKGFIAILDQLEDLYRYSIRSENESWSRQLELLWNNITNDLLSLGIMKIDGEKTTYNKDLHTAADVSSNPDYGEGIITEVLRCGYIYKNHILRKAKVIVNKSSNTEE